MGVAQEFQIAGQGAANTERVNRVLGLVAPLAKANRSLAEKLLQGAGVNGSTARVLEALETGDRDRARQLIITALSHHAEASKQAPQIQPGDPALGQRQLSDKWGQQSLAGLYGSLDPEQRTLVAKFLGHCETLCEYADELIMRTNQLLQNPKDTNVLVEIVQIETGLLRVRETASAALPRDLLPVDQYNYLCSLGVNFCSGAVDATSHLIAALQAGEQKEIMTMLELCQEAAHGVAFAAQEIDSVQVNIVQIRTDGRVGVERTFA